MYSIENKSEESRAIQNNSEKHEPIAQFKDNRSLSAVEEGKNTAQLEKKENLTGMPDDLKEGIESLSGFSMDDVRVHYNSSKPATVQALAYTQGTDIHVAPGQEKHLPHEAWHVAQQMAGRVSPTTNINGMQVNDNVELEREADVMGEKAVQCKRNPYKNEKKIKGNTDILQFMCWTIPLKNTGIEGRTPKNIQQAEQKAKLQPLKKTVWPTPRTPQTFNALLGDFAKAESDNCYYVAFGKKGEFQTSQLFKLETFFWKVYQKKIFIKSKPSNDLLIQYFKNFSEDFSISGYVSYKDAIDGVSSKLCKSLEESIEIPEGKHGFNGRLEYIRDKAYSESHNGESVEHAFEKNMEEFAQFHTFFLDKCANILKYGWVNNADNAIHQIAQDYLLCFGFNKRYDTLVGIENSFNPFYFNGSVGMGEKKTLSKAIDDSLYDPQWKEKCKKSLDFKDRILTVYRTFDLTAIAKKYTENGSIELFGGGHGGSLGTALNYSEKALNNGDDVAIVKVTIPNIDISNYEIKSGEGELAKQESDSVLPLREYVFNRAEKGVRPPAAIKQAFSQIAPYLSSSNSSEKEPLL